MKERLALHRIDIEEVVLGTPRPYDGDTRMEAGLRIAATLPYALPAGTQAAA